MYFRVNPDTCPSVADLAPAPVVGVSFLVVARPALLRAVAISFSLHPCGGGPHFERGHPPCHSRAGPALSEAERAGIQIV
jgi:hypothetical protein